jgi:hypothetical protein
MEDLLSLLDIYYAGVAGDFTRDRYIGLRSLDPMIPCIRQQELEPVFFVGSQGFRSPSIVAERQREQRVESVRIRRGVARHVKQLEKELPDIDNDIDTLVRGSPAWRDKEELLISFPGVSNTLARWWRISALRSVKTARRPRVNCKAAA